MQSIIKHLINIVDMYLEQEEKHYEEDCWNNNKDNHIFHDLLAVSHWIKENHTMSIKIEKDIPIPKTDWENIREYRKKHIKMIAKLKVGESIVVKNRTRETVRIYAWWAIRSMGLWQKDLKEKYLIKSIDKKTQRVWRIK